MLSKVLIGSLAVIGAAACATLFVMGLRTVQALDRRGDLVQDQAVGAPGVDRCVLRDLSGIRSEQGFVAIVRDINCPEPLAQGTGYFAVFVHRDGAKNTKQNLVFQYEPGFSGQVMSGPPQVSWLPNGSLKIKELGPIEELDKQLTNVHGIAIVYYLGQVQSVVNGVTNVSKVNSR